MFARDNMATFKMESMADQLDQITLTDQFANAYKAKLIELTLSKQQNQKVVAQDALGLDWRGPGGIVEGAGIPLNGLGGPLDMIHCN